MNSDQNHPGWLSYIGDDILPSYIYIYTDYFRSHEVRIPINQHFMESQLITAQFLKATPRTGCFFLFLGIESI